MNHFVVVVLAAVACSVQAIPQPQFARPSGRLPDYGQLCQTLRNPALVRQYVNCALDIPGACAAVQDVQGIRDYLRSALPAALGRGQCNFCDQGDKAKIAFLAKEFRLRYKKETSQLLNHYRAQIAANGGLRAQTAADLAGAPASC
jgi:hypothetical protein